MAGFSHTVPVNWKLHLPLGKQKLNTTKCIGLVLEGLVLELKQTQLKILCGPLQTAESKGKIC